MIALKKGDRVRYVYHNGGGHPWNDRVGPITSINGKVVRVLFDGHTVATDCTDYNLQLENTPMTALKIGDRVRYVGDTESLKGSIGELTRIPATGDTIASIKLDNGEYRYPRFKNLELVKTLDPTKTLLLLSSLSTPRPEVKLIGTDAEGGLIVNTFGTGKDSHWMIFNPDGTFKSSPNGGGKALKLINQITETIETTLCDSPIRITTVDGKLTKVDVL